MWIVNFNSRLRLVEKLAKRNKLSFSDKLR